jgi:predicted CXXCH cytochrome family protein
VRLRILLLLAIGICTLRGVTQDRVATSVREADSPCGQCHRQILESYLKTPMANASGLATEKLYAGSFTHAPSGVLYAISDQSGQATLNYTLPTNPPTRISERLQYFLGSGHLGLTYLYSKDGYLLESPIAYYSALQGYAMKPGFQRSRELPAALTLNPSCLRCHMSSVQKQVSGTDNLYTGLPFEHVGVTCESCHGESRQHVASRGRIPVVDPIKLSPENRDSTCNICHLEGDTNVERRNRSVLDFKPGDDLNDFLSYFVYVGENTTHRAVSEIEQFNSSRCKIASGQRMSCMSCHDPHTSPSAEERVSFFRAKCLTCHTQVKYATQHYNSNPDCTSCHMPRTGAQNIPHVAWTDHRIRQHPDQPDLAAATTQAQELVPILTDKSSPRDLALAYYNLVVVKGLAVERPKAWQMLIAAERSDPDDLAVLRALGITAELNGDDNDAKNYYLAVLKRDPENLPAGTNLGTLLAKGGDVEAAAARWQQTFRQNADIPELGENLAKAQCLLGRKDAAEATLKIVLTYSPGLSHARQALAAMEDGSQPCLIHAVSENK